MEPPVQINTQRLKPLCQRTSRTVMSILENGDISMEILAKNHTGDQGGYQMVQEMVHISGDGSKVQLYQNNQGNTGSGSVNGEASSWSHQQFVFPDLPPKQLKKYIHAYRFVELVKSRTPKIVLTTDRAKCKIMENSPGPDFLVDFHDGMAIHLSKQKVHITDSDGNTATSEAEKLFQSFSDDILERFVYCKQCESECLRLVESFNGLTKNHESPELFPVSIGTSSSPVIIPQSQQTSTLYNTPQAKTLTPDSSDNHTRHVREISQPPGETEVVTLQQPHVLNPTNSAFSIPTQRIDFLPKPIETTFSPTLNTSCVHQQLYHPFHFTQSPGATLESIYVNSQEEKNETELHTSSDCSQSNLLNIENGAIFPNAMNGIPQVYQSQDNPFDRNDRICENLPCPHSNDTLTLPELTSQQTINSAHVPEEQLSLSEGYNKLKYCSKLSDTGFGDQDELLLQQQSLQDEFFAEHLDMSGLRVRGFEKVPCHHQSTHSTVSEPTTLQQHANSQAGIGVAQNTMQTFQSSSDISLHSQTFSSYSSSSEKKQTTNSSRIDNSLGIEEQVSSQVKTDISDTCNFTPMLSSAIINPYLEPSYSQSPKKTQRKVLSLDLSTALENQMKSLDLNSSRSDSMNAGTPHSAGSDTCMYSTQHPLLKNTPRNISLNSTFSNSKISDRLKVRQDQLNSSLPLSYDSKLFGMSGIPATPQKQFLQSSDISDQGASEFGLPPQVRHSLDLSTSSNYSDSPSSSQSSSCEPLYQVFVPYVGWASYYASGAVWVLYNDGTQLGVKANEKTMTFIDQDGSQRKYHNKDIVPDVVKMKLEKFPSILAAVLNCQR